MVRLRPFAMIAFLAASLTLVLAGCSRETGQAEDRALPPVVLAAASLQEALEAAAQRWAAQGHVRPVLSFAASSALARQVESGAPADIFFSADEQWMDVLEGKGLLRNGTRAPLLGNSLVLIAPKNSTASVSLDHPAGFGAALGDSRLSLADPDAVPAGRYAKAALQQLGLWPAVAHRLARAENVRAALALVERGEAPLGIVYASDAAASNKVRVLVRFPRSSHPPIIYPVAVLNRAASPDAQGFRAFLSSDEALDIFRKHGFIVL